MWQHTIASSVVAAVACLAPGEALAQTPVLVNARVEISAAVAGSSATLEAIERQAASRDRVRQQEIAALQARLTEAEGRGAAEVAQLQSQLVEAREALVADLASRDRAYAEEIAVFRREVTSIASTAEGAAGLARYNAGDRVGGIAVLDRLRRARDLARQTRADIESAAEARQIATLAQDARGKSDPAFDTSAVIARFEEVTRLDPGQSSDWFQLIHLYLAAGRSADALAAARRLEAVATNDQDRSVSRMFAADILLSQGDRAGARALYQLDLEMWHGLWATRPASVEMARAVTVLLDRIADVIRSEGDRDGALLLYRQSLEIRERLSADDPASVDFADAASVSRERIGDVLLSQGDRDGAMVEYGRSLEVFERLAAADPGSADRARSVSVALNKVGEVFMALGAHDEALSRFQRSLEIRERLSAADPASANRARDVHVSLYKVASALLGKGDRDGALAHRLRGLEIIQRLSADNPASADWARDVSLSLLAIGDVLLSQGDRDAARARYLASLEIAERLSAADPMSAYLARDVFILFWKIAQLSGERRDWEGALASLRNMEARGTLAPADQPFIASLEEFLAGPNAPAN